MRKIERPPMPRVLAENWKAWGRACSASGRFHWHQVDGQQVDQHVMPVLLEMSRHHCAFCDSYPLGKVAARPTIEHFFPKARYPKIAFYWANLFPCCDVCQVASARWWRESRSGWEKRALLKPDHLKYFFLAYFVAELTTGEIVPNPGAPKGAQIRAAATLDAYSLNSPDRKLYRKKMARRGVGDATLDDLPYRDFMEAASPAEAAGPVRTLPS